MPGLNDIVPVTREVQGVTIRGVSARNLANLFEQFPQLGELSMGRNIGAQLVTLAKDALGTIIAAGTGEMGSKEAVGVADNLPLETQLDLIEAIIQLTFPKGPSSFVARLQSAQASVVGPLAPSKAPDTISESASTISQAGATDTTQS